MVISFGDKVWSRNDGPKDITRPLPLVNEEADNRIVAHINDLLTEGCPEEFDLIVRTCDSDVVIILISFYWKFASNHQNLKLWVEFGTGKNKKTIACHLIASKLGEDVSGALMCFHTFTGADSTCAFYTKSKAHWFKMWMSNEKKEEITHAFKVLSWTRNKHDVNTVLPVIEQFVCSSYGFPLLSSVNEVRFRIYCTSTTKNLRHLPPSRAALEMHVLRSTFQSGCIWGNTLSQEDPPDVTNWGWTVAESGTLSFKWTDINPDNNTMTLNQLVKTCKCSKANTKCTTCNCGKLKFKCLKFCSCRRSCVNIDIWV